MGTSSGGIIGRVTQRFASSLTIFTQLGEKAGARQAARVMAKQGALDMEEMSDTHRDERKPRPTLGELPGGLRKLILAFGIAGLYFGVMSLREPSRSTASPLPILPESTAVLPGQKLLGSFRGREGHIEVYTSPSGTLFRLLDPQGRALTAAVPAGLLLQRYPQLDLNGAIASVRSGGGLMMADDPTYSGAAGR